MEIRMPRYENEQPLFVLSAIFAGLIWAGLIIGTLGIGLIYVLFGALFYLIVRALFIAGIKGNGVRITKDQFPELHGRVIEASKRLGLSTCPEAYLLNDRGVFNAFAIRYLGRDFIVLFTELVEHAEEREGALDFIIGHEMAHHALGHLRWAAFLLPSRMVPLLGPAYSRACEYSCDLAGLDVAGKPDAAVSGLAVLAAGGRFAGRLNVEEYLKQRLETGGFWMAVLELGMTHPYLPKRVGAIVRRVNPALVPPVSRNPFSYILSPFFGFAGAGGGGAGAIVAVIVIIGILAAIAVPSFMKYQQRAREAAVRQDLQRQELDQTLKQFDEQFGPEPEQPAE